MKKLFFAVAIAATTIFASCTKDATQITDKYQEPTTAGSVVNISFSEEEQTTRAFFTSSTTAEDFEKEIKSATIFVFDQMGDVIIERNFSTAEMIAARSSFVLPGVETNDRCKFYVVANTTVTGIASESALLATMEESALQYNGTFAEVTTKSKRSGGFVMTGSTTQTIASSATNVSITLKRTVAKVAVQATLGAGFTSSYDGTVRVNKVTLSRAAIGSRLFKQTTPATGAMAYAHEQLSNKSGNNYQNLFYIYENGILSSGSRVMLTVDATYDRDGDLSTTTDQKPITYQVELDGKASGEIVRNGYYRVAATIVGVEGSDVTISISAANWETVATQNVTLGE